MKSIIQKGLIIIWALAIFYLHLGSLVNFHQHHLWKKYLIPTVIASKKDKKDACAFIIKVKYHSGNLGFKFDPVSNQVFASSHARLIEYTCVSFVLGEKSLFKADLPRALSLRAPPLV